MSDGAAPIVSERGFASVGGVPDGVLIVRSPAGRVGPAAVASN